MIFKKNAQEGDFLVFPAPRGREEGTRLCWGLFPSGDGVVWGAVVPEGQRAAFPAGPVGEDLLTLQETCAGSGHRGRAAHGRLWEAAGWCVHRLLCVSLDASAMVHGGLSVIPTGCQ